MIVFVGQVGTGMRGREAFRKLTTHIFWASGEMSFEIDT